MHSGQLQDRGGQYGVYSMQCGLLYSKHGLSSCRELQCMCSRLWGQRADRKHIWLYRMYGGQLQTQQWQCSMYCVRFGILHPKYWLSGCEQLQCMCSGIRG